MDEDKTYLIIWGNPVDGFFFEGPFPDYDECQDYAEANRPDDTEYWISELAPPVIE